MTETPGPETLRGLAAVLRGTAASAALDTVLALADAWQVERAERRELEERLSAAQKRVELLEKDRRWWQDNAIKRRRRSEERRSGRQGG